ncbi:hypothetical protein [Haliangium sp.]|uniref:hypothetical protein n=1 Tax=Haliangium sp. TaxID=2663208 RepID=UPI003D150107
MTSPENIRYKFVELSVVTDESLETVVNECAAQGWQFDRIHFVVTEASRRPAMAFVSFVRELLPGEQSWSAPLTLQEGANPSQDAPERLESEAEAEAEAAAANATSAQDSNPRAETSSDASPEEVSDEEPTGVFYD